MCVPDTRGVLERKQRDSQSTPIGGAPGARSRSLQATQPYGTAASSESLLSGAGRRRALLLLVLGGLEQWQQLLLGGELPARESAVST